MDRINREFRISLESLITGLLMIGEARSPTQVTSCIVCARAIVDEVIKNNPPKETNYEKS